MAPAADPYYNRKPVPGNDFPPGLALSLPSTDIPYPDELIKDVGVTGLTPDQEYWNREKKYTVNGADVRRFSSSSKGGLEPLDDPYYGRRRVSSQSSCPRRSTHPWNTLTPLPSDAEIHDVGQTGLSPEEEYWNRERKYSVTGVDVRKFSKGTKSSLEPQSDPYYNRKKISSQSAPPLSHS